MRIRAAEPSLIAFDMDGTLLDGRVVYTIGGKFGFMSEIKRIVNSTKVPYVRSRKIAELLGGLSASAFSDCVRKIPLMAGAGEAVGRLRKTGHKVGIISDSYSQATEIVADRLAMDFHVANTLEVRNGFFTGRLRMPMGWKQIGCSCKQSICKRYHLMHLAKVYGVDPSHTVAIGDSGSDRCMVENATLGIWFNPSEDTVLDKKKHVIRTKDLNTIVQLLEDQW